MTLGERRPENHSTSLSDFISCTFPLRFGNSKFEYDQAQINILNLAILKPMLLISGVNESCVFHPTQETLLLQHCWMRISFTLRRSA